MNEAGGREGEAACLLALTGLLGLVDLNQLVGVVTLTPM